MDDVRRFQHLGEEWEAFRSAATAAAFGFPSEPAARIGLRSVTHPERGEFRTNTPWDRLAAMTDGELIRLLEGALTIAAIEHSRFVWRTAEGIAKETGIELTRVRECLEDAGDGVLESEETDPSGRALYTTQDHFLRGAYGTTYSDVESPS
jgi:hypothetical protein